MDSLAIKFKPESLLSDHNHLHGSLIENLPREIKSSRRQSERTRGRRGGRELRRRGNRPPLPSTIVCNAKSPGTKMDGRRLLWKAWFEYGESSAMLFTEMWLRPEIPSPTVEIKGFTYICADRTEGPACMSMTVGVDSLHR